MEPFASSPEGPWLLTSSPGITERRVTPDDIVADIKAAEAELADVETEVDRVVEKVRDGRR